MDMAPIPVIICQDMYEQPSPTTTTHQSLSGQSEERDIGAALSFDVLSTSVKGPGQHVFLSFNSRLLIIDHVVINVVVDKKQAGDEEKETVCPGR